MDSHIRREKIVKSCSRLNKSIIRNLIPLKPKCASKRFKIGVPQNIEKAYQDIQETQEKFIIEREKIRLKLHIGSTYREDISEGELFKNQNHLLGLEGLFSQNLNKTLDIKRKLLSPIKRYYNRSPERAKDIDMFIDHCVEVKSQNERLKSKIPEMRRSLSKKFKRMKNAVEIKNQQNNQEFDRSLTSLHKKMIMMFEINNNS